jgi:hypothetical protein
MRPKNVQEFLDQVWWPAALVAEKHGIFTSVMLAQAGLESQWGKKKSSYFGDQVIAHCKKSKVTLPTTQSGKRESGEFCRYESFHAAAEGYADLINNEPQFKTAKANKKNYQQFILSMARGYNHTGHTPPPKPLKDMNPAELAAWREKKAAEYAALVNQVIAGFKLKEFDKPLAELVKPLSNTSGRVEEAVRRVESGGYAEAFAYLNGSWMLPLVNVELPELARRGHLDALIENISAADSKLNEDQRNRLWVALLAVKFKRLGERMSFPTFQDKVAAEKMKGKDGASHEVANAWSLIHEDQKKVLEEFLDHGPN